jgi:chitinase
MAITANGVTVNASMSFPVTGWTSWTSRTQSASLPAGAVLIRAREVSAGPNVDSLTVTGGATPTVSATPRATARPTARPTSTATTRATATSTARATATATTRATATATTPRATPTTGGAAAWAPGVAYSVGNLVTHGGVTYSCRQAHTSQVGWEPNTTPALWLAQ